MVRRPLTRSSFWPLQVTAFVCAFTSLVGRTQAGELSGIAADVQSGAKHPDHDNDYDHDDCYEDSDDDGNDRWTSLAFGFCSALSSVNPDLEFTAYPYENDHCGYLAELTNPDAATHPVSTRLWAEYGSEFDNIEMVSAGLLVEGDHRFGFDVTWRTYFEDLGAEGNDDLSTGDANLLYRLWQSESSAIRLGGGASWLEFDGEVDAGYNVTMSADFFPLRPLIVSLEGDLGNVGHALLVHGRATVGLNLRHAEVFTGIDHLKIDHGDLTCLVTGLRTWW